MWFYRVTRNIVLVAKFLVFVVLGVVFLIFGIAKNRFKIKGFSLEKVKHFILEFPKKKLVKGFIFSLIRFLIFSFQFYFLLQIFKVELSYLEAMTLITSMYLIVSIIPSIFIFDVIVKGSVAVYLFSIAGVNELIILCIITLMWILNFVIPSLIGSYYVLRFKLPITQD